jgi:hypothetical protein
MSEGNFGEINGDFGEAAEVRAAESGVETPLPGTPETPDQPLSPGDEQADEANAGNTPLPSEDTSLQGMQARFKEIEGNENPDKFGQRVDVYTEATKKYIKDESGTVQNLLDMRNDEQNVDKLDSQFSYLEKNVQQIFTEYEKHFVADLQGLQGDALVGKAAELLSQFTGQQIAAESITFLDENGQIRDSEAFQRFLSESTAVAKMVEKFAQVHEVMKLPIKERAAMAKQLQAETELIAADETKSEEDKKNVLEEFTALSKQMEGALDAMNVPGVINIIFAVEHGYGSYGRFDAFHNGLEKKNDQSEQRTLAALKQVFSDNEKRTIFLREVLQIEEGKQLSYTELQPKMKELLEIDSSLSDEQKQYRVGEVKKRLFGGFEKVGKTGLLSRLDSPEQVNLSPTVVQSLVTEVEKMR